MSVKEAMSFGWVMLLNFGLNTYLFTNLPNYVSKICHVIVWVMLSNSAEEGYITRKHYLSYGSEFTRKQLETHGCVLGTMLTDTFGPFY